MPAALILLSPWVDMTKSHWQEGSSLFTNKYSDYVSFLGRPNSCNKLIESKDNGCSGRRRNSSVHEGALSLEYVCQRQ
jgi:hypothetical protein